MDFSLESVHAPVVINFLSEHTAEEGGTDYRLSFAISFPSSPSSRLVGPVRPVGKRDELHGGGLLLRPFLRPSAVLLPGRPLGAGRQPAGPDAHEVQHAVPQLQRRTAQHHTHW